MLQLILGGLWVKGQVDRLAPRRLLRTLCRRKLRPHQVLIDHRQLGVQIVVIRDDGGDFPPAIEFGCLQAVGAGDDLELAVTDVADPDRVDEPDLVHALSQRVQCLVTAVAGIRSMPDLFDGKEVVKRRRPMRLPIALTVAAD